MSKALTFGRLLEVGMSKKCTPLWREAHVEVKMYKAPQVRTAFGSWDVEKVHAVVVRSKVGSQNVQNISDSLEVEMLKKCTVLWREANVEVKSGKTRRSPNTFGSFNVEKVASRSTF